MFATCHVSNWFIIFSEQRNTSVKQETHFIEEPFFNEDSMDVLGFDEPIDEPIMDIEDRQMAIMEKLV